MSCTCKYGSGRVCGFCEHRARTNERLKKLEGAQASADYARGVAAERARVVAWLRTTMAVPGWCDETVGVLMLLVQNIERGEHEENGNG